MSTVIVAGGFEDMSSRTIRFLDEASLVGPVHMLLYSDESLKARGGETPKFPQQERLYFFEAVRYVDRVSICSGPSDENALPEEYATPAATWVVDQAADSPRKRSFCQTASMDCRVIEEEGLRKFPEAAAEIAAGIAAPTAPTRKKVIVTGCYDWFHTGHVRFFEEVSKLGDLYVVVGHDANIELLKGPGHPMFPQAERRYMAGSIRHVRMALISSGNGWLDAEPEIEWVKPHIYAVNEDGDQPEKREYCEAHGIEYRILKRTPKQGLPKRQSTDLRGF